MTPTFHSTDMSTCEKGARNVSGSQKSRCRRMVAQPGLEPGTGIGPLAVSIGAGSRKRLRRFFDRQADEEAQLCNCGGVGVLVGQRRDRRVQVQNSVGVGLSQWFGVREVDSLSTATALFGHLAARV